ncbi:leukocyte cell derived chemotaxin 2, tandem duplicate 1 [Sardina pilchardus]|uniref:leukocyte cell derived chemotaxin 2, tandem duplicate 1 n=1 Tax=Sardina pilchardus TaxID=27697 RepID=UPI002E152A96
MKVAIVLAVLVSTVVSTDQLFGHQEKLRHERSLVKFGALCSGNPTNQKRGCDVKGCGNYGAKRGSRTHKGLDIVCNDGATVYAPFDVQLNGKAVPYGSPSDLQKLINDGVNLSGEGLCFKLFYVKPDKYRGSLKKGDRIGILHPMQRVYRGITSHTHVQMCDRSDPTKYF